MRDIPVGNGQLLVTFDSFYQIRDIYFPHVGQENHTEGFPFRFGVWADGRFSWIFWDEWTRSLKYQAETLVTEVTLINETLGLSISCNDTVASHEQVFLRRVRVQDLSKAKARSIRVFFHQDFRIYENKIGDTAFWRCGGNELRASPGLRRSALVDVDMGRIRADHGFERLKDLA